jgi:hypothetical protein
MSTDQKLFATLVDDCKYNSQGCQKELVAKMNYQTDHTRDTIRDSLSQLLRMMKGSPQTQGDYNYPWIYTTKSNGVITGGHFHCYPNSDVQATRYEVFKNWFSEVVAEWAMENMASFIEVLPEKKCAYIQQLQYEV